MGDSFFEDVRNLVGYLLSSIENMSPIRLQKSLYLLYAFYGSTYGSMEDKEGNSEINTPYPRYLFEKMDGEEVNFQGWRYGPVIPEVYHGFKKGSFVKNPNPAEFGSPNGQDIKIFIDGVMKEIQDLSDFALVDRTHQDKSWKEAYLSEPTFHNGVIDRGMLIDEYKMQLVSDSEIA